MTDLEMAVKLAEKVKEAGGTAYFVGGYVRDKLMNRENKDIDIEIHNLSQQKLETILDTLGERLEFGKSFGIYNIKGFTIDIALPRTERPTGNGHRDFDVKVEPFIGTYEAAIRRDFTINALMEDVLTGEIIDHFGGQRDIENKKIAHVCDRTFIEDPLRVLRAAQFAARFGFSIDNKTMDLCRTIDITALSRERIIGEMEKALLKADAPSVFFEILSEMGKNYYWFEELENLRGVEQNREHHKEGDAWKHTMMVLDEAAKRRGNANNPLGFMLSALCHDFGKAICTEEIDGIIHSYRHEELGLPLVEDFISRLTSEVELKKYVLNMVELHMMPNMMANMQSSRKKSNRLFDKSLVPEDLVELSICDGLGKIPAIFDSENFLKERLAHFKITMGKPYVMGRDLIEAGLEPGEDFKEILEYAHKLRLASIEKQSALRQTLAYARKMRKEKSECYRA